MALDPSISLGVKPVEIANPINQFAQVAQLQNYQRQNDLATRAIEQEDALNRAYASAYNPQTGDIDVNKLRSNIAGANLGSKLPTIEKSLLETRELKSKVGKGELDLRLAKADQAIKDIARFTTRDEILSDIQRNVNEGNIDISKAQQIAASIPQDPSKIPAWQLQTMRGILSAKDQLEQHFQEQDYGGGKRVISMNKYGGGPAVVVQGSNIKKTATIADQLAERKFAWEKAHPGYELKENEDGSVYGVNKDTLQAVPVTIGGVSPANNSPRIPAATVTPAKVQTIPGMNSVLDQTPVAPTTPVAGTPFKGKGTALTESQGNATGFGMRAFESNRLLNDLEKGGTVSGGRIKGLVEGTLNALVPYQGEKLAAGAGNVMNVLPGVLGGPNDQQQQYQQAKMNFITAVLRKESGASIAPSEFDTEDKKYFPQPGESAKTIAQKQKAREMAVEALKIMAGPGAKNIGANTGGWEVVR